MATIHLPLDFKEFLRLLNAHKVEYVLIGVSSESPATSGPGLLTRRGRHTSLSFSRRACPERSRMGRRPEGTADLPFYRPHARWEGWQSEKGSRGRGGRDGGGHRAKQSQFSPAPPGAGKGETRNAKSETIAKHEKGEMAKTLALIGSRFRNCGLGHSGLFRASGFGFRASRRMWTAAGAKSVDGSGTGGRMDGLTNGNPQHNGVPWAARIWSLEH